MLLVNLGSPAAATAHATRTYLRQFLSDPRVVELPRLRWWLLRNLVILPLRPIRAARAYRKIWADNGPPLVATGRHQASDLEWELSKRVDRPIPVFCGMRYGKPSLAAALGVLRQRGCHRILVSAAVPAVLGDDHRFGIRRGFSASFRPGAGFPRSEPLPATMTTPAYIGALASSIHQSWKRRWQADASCS